MFKLNDGKTTSFCICATLSKYLLYIYPGKTTAYTYESFFASDGRSKNPASLYNVYKPKYKCAECGKNYATSSNLSRWMRETWSIYLYLEILFQQTQADPPEPLHEHGQEVWSLWQDVREHARPEHARAHTQPQPQVSHMWESFLQTLAA